LRDTYAREVLEVARLPETVDTELQVLRIGDLALVALPGEIFVSLGQGIKADSPFPLTAVVGLANDYVGYVPTRAAFDQGGYETWAARSAWPAPGTGEAMVAAALSLLRALTPPTTMTNQRL
jgi:neutral ceramidase